MKFLKHLLGVGAMLLAISVVAQDHEGREKHKSADERAKHQTTKMTEHLGLDEKQQTIVWRINLDHAIRSQKIRENNEDKEAAKAELKKLNARKEHDLEGVLTPEQFELFIKHKQERKEKAHQKQKSPEERAKHQTAKMTEQLDLDEKQQTLVAEINLDHALHMQKIKESQENKEVLKEEFKKLRAQKENALKAVLTPEQFDLLKKHQQERKEQGHQKHKECKE